MEQDKSNLIKGPIFSSLIRLSLPIMGASFLQMAYNLTDMFWIGFNGPNSIAAVGIGGFFLWLSLALIRLISVGTEVNVAQRTGAGDENSAKGFAKNGIKLSLVFAFAYTFFIIVFRHYAIAFFEIPEQEVRVMAENYLGVVILGSPFVFFSSVITAIFNARGNSAQAFKVNAIGLAINMILDPILILGVANIGGIGEIGAAIATIISQFMVSLVFYILIFRKGRLFSNCMHINNCDCYNCDCDESSEFESFSDSQITKKILNMGIAPAMHSALFTFIAMIIARFVAGYGAEANAVQKLGSQIESISWMTATGVGSALSAFIGQNYGAKKYDRVIKGYKIGMIIAITIGGIANILLFFGARLLMLVFTRDPISIEYGIEYLKILSLSQLFMCVEIIGTGIFNGLGLTKLPAILGVSLNLMRIPMSMVLMATSLGLTGIWWSISSTSIAKGILVFLILYLILIKRFNKKGSII